MELDIQNNRDKSTGTEIIKLRKAASGIKGLDEILEGGFPAERTTLISGGPGTGKSVLGLEFLYRGALSGNPGIFLSFEEPEGDIRRNAITFGWDLPSLEKSGKFFLMGGQIDPKILISGDFNMNGLLAVIDGKAKEMGADRIVIDAVDILIRLFNDPKRQQDEIFTLNAWLKDRRMTTVLTAKSITGKNAYEYGYLDFMADCVIHLDQRIREQVRTRRLHIVKYRGSGYGGNEYPFIITNDGAHFNAITDMEMNYISDFKPVSSGSPSLDRILGGGVQSGTCIMITGSTGTGKTCLASTFTSSACGEGHRVLYINFEEDLDSMFSGMLSLGIDLRPAMEKSALRFINVMPESRGVEEHLFRITCAIDQFRPGHLVVDAVSACRRMGGESAAFDFVMRLVNTCRKKGITVILTNQSDLSREDYSISGIGISSIIDTIIALHYRDKGHEVGRALLVKKSRRANHSNRYHEYALTGRGITFDMEQREKCL